MSLRRRDVMHRRKETMNPLYHGIPAGDDVENNIQPFEFEDAHVRKKDRPTRRRFGPLALLVALLLALLVLIVGSGVRNWAGKKRQTPEAAASAAKANNIDEGLDPAANARSGPRMIFCYGDSLTSGLSSRGTYPYSKYLEQELNTLFNATSEPASAKSESENQTQATIVHHFGVPGWSASNMLYHLHYKESGACDILHRFPTLDLMVILAGTNDVGQLTNAAKSVAREILGSIIDLHRSVINCAVENEENVGFRTLAVGIPGSAYQEEVRVASELTLYINNALKRFVASEEKVSYVDFPFSYEEGDPKWDADGLHLTQEGYETLARELAPPVKNILDAI